MDTSIIVFAFGLTLFVGLSTGIGSALAFFAKKIDKDFLSITLGFSAGITVFISLDELLPAAQKYGKHHLSIYRLIIGMAVMAFSRRFFK